METAAGAENKAARFHACQQPGNRRLQLVQARSLASEGRVVLNQQRRVDIAHKTKLSTVLLFDLLDVHA